MPPSTCLACGVFFSADSPSPFTSARTCEQFPGNFPSQLHFVDLVGRRGLRNLEGNRNEPTSLKDKKYCAHKREHPAEQDSRGWPGGGVKGIFAAATKKKKKNALRFRPLHALACVLLVHQGVGNKASLEPATTRRAKTLVPSTPTADRQESRKRRTPSACCREDKKQTKQNRDKRASRDACG